MKKVLFAAIALVASVTPAMAEESFAPEAGDFSLELQFNPFSNNFDTFKLERLQGTYMLSDKDGLRFGLGLDVHNNKTIKNEDHDGHVSSKYGDFSINLGYERHFYNYKRVDLYAGAEIIYTHRWLVQRTRSMVLTTFGLRLLKASTTMATATMLVTTSVLTSSLASISLFTRVSM